MGFILFIAVAIIGMIVQWRFKNKFKQYSEIPLLSGLTGKDVAERMLRDHGIYDVKVIAAEGQLTDHYNPGNHTVNLSTAVYHGRSVAAAAVAAHECGHAVQHAKAYSWLTFRTAIVPVVNVASNLLQWVLMLGIFMYGFYQNDILLFIGFCAMAVVTLFSFITLPVEFDASNRALAWLKANGGIMQAEVENNQAKDALWRAAMTYVVAALGSLAQLLYWAMILFGGRSRD
jgi:Zn-dependent membrane protease YugP